jgi:plastocyanin
MPRSVVVGLIAMVALVACSGSSKDVDGHVADGKPIDSKAIDAKAVDAKLFMDAHIPSTINVVAGCTDITAGQIGLTVTAGDTMAFSPTTGTITHGDYVMFTSTSDHNMVNEPNAGRLACSAPARSARTSHVCSSPSPARTRGCARCTAWR